MFARIEISPYGSRSIRSGRRIQAAARSRHNPAALATPQAIFAGARFLFCLYSITPQPAFASTAADNAGRRPTPKQPNTDGRRMRMRRRDQHAIRRDSHRFRGNRLHLVQQIAAHHARIDNADDEGFVFPSSRTRHRPHVADQHAPPSQRPAGSCQIDDDREFGRRNVDQPPPSSAEGGLIVRLGRRNELIMPPSRAYRPRLAGRMPRK